PLFAMQGPLSVGTPRPLAGLALRTATSVLPTWILHSLATLGSHYPHQGVGFQPSEGSDYRGWRWDTTVASR
ncbi:MAG: hypothetical protein V3T17_15140, partial [Pseudomonadales bacterium]